MQAKHSHPYYLPSIPIEGDNATPSILRTQNTSNYNDRSLTISGYRLELEASSPASNRLAKMGLGNINKSPRYLTETEVSSISFVKSPKSMKQKKADHEHSTFGKAGRALMQMNLYDMPSPASYNNQKKDKKSIDFNIKGYGSGFLSKDARFHYIPYVNTGPGPGQYVILPNQSPNLSPIRLETKKYSHPKVIRPTKVRPVVNEFNVPGPGNYKINYDSVFKVGSTFNSCFNSTSPKSIPLYSNIGM